MRTIQLRLDLGVPRMVIVAALGLCALAIGSNDLSSESVTLTTYYPAPSAVYTKLLDQGSAWLARDGGSVMVGSTASPSTWTPTTTNPVLEVDNGGAQFLGRLGIGSANDPGPLLQVNGNVNYVSAINISGVGGGSLQFPYDNVNGRMQIQGSPQLQFQLAGTTILGLGSTAGGVVNLNPTGNVMTVQGAVTIHESGCSYVPYTEGTTPCPGSGYTTMTAGLIKCGNLANPFPGSNPGNYYANDGTMVCCPWPSGAGAVDAVKCNGF